MRLWELSVREPKAATRPGERSLQLLGEDGHGALLPGSEPGATLRHRDQPIRSRARTGLYLDRLPPVDGRERLRSPPRARARADGQYPRDGRHHSPHRRRRTLRTTVAGGRRDRWESSVSWR